MSELLIKYFADEDGLMSSGTPKLDQAAMNAILQCVRSAVAAEREACAKIFDRDDWPTGDGHLLAAAIPPRVAAAAIRSRGETKE